jgi:hypothetical protein
MIGRPSKAWATLAALAAAGAVAATSASGASPPKTISFTVHNNGIAYLTRAGLTDSFPGGLTTGDQIFARDILSEGTRTIGYDNEECTATFDGNDLCHTVSVFPGKGDVEATWLWVGRNTSEFGPHRFTGVIDGGTGAYAHASGQFDAIAGSDGTVQFTASLR